MEVVELNINDATSEQLRKMKHALGLSRKSKPYRNYYSLNSPNDEWEDLINKGFANKCKGINGGSSVVYYVNFEATKLIYGKRMSKKFYDEL